MSKIIADLVADALAVFAGQTITGEAIEAHTSARYFAARGRHQTFGSYVKMSDALQAAGVEYTEHTEVDLPVWGSPRP